jgi:hypothetical protein
MADWHTIELIKMRKLISIFSIFAIALYSCASMLINPFVFITETLGLLYGAEVAYDLQQISDSYSGPVVRVRRSSDSQESDFTSAQLHDFSYIGDNLITNGTFDTDSDWTKTSPWTISGGVATMEWTQTFYPLGQSILLEAGKTYRVDVDVLALTGAVRCWISSDYEIESLRLGRNSFITEYVENAEIQFSRLSNGGGGSVTIDNVRVTEYSPSTAEQWVIDGGGTQRGYMVEWLDGNYALGPELVADPNFDNPSAWLTDTGLTISGGQATLTADGANFIDLTSVADVFESNTSYLISVNVESCSTDQYSVWLRGAGGDDLGLGYDLRLNNGDSGVQKAVITTGTVANKALKAFVRSASTSGSLVFNSYSVRETIGTPNNLSQSTAANQPLIIDNGALLEDGLLFDSTDFLLGDSGWDIGLNDATIAGQLFVADGTPSNFTTYLTSHDFLGNNSVSVSIIGNDGRTQINIVDSEGNNNVFQLPTTQTLPDAPLVNFVLTLDRDEDATFTWKEVGGSATGTGSIDISSTASIDIGAGNSNPATVGNDTDFANSGFKALFVWHELLSPQAQTAILSLE